MIASLSRLAGAGFVRARVALLGSLSLVLLLGACATPDYPPAPRQAATADYHYRIGPLDTINVIVWRNPELSIALPVRPDGKITTPLVDDLVAHRQDADPARARHRAGARPSSSATRW